VELRAGRRGRIRPLRQGGGLYHVADHLRIHS
jgi:hypothetical protein